MAEDVAPGDDMYDDVVGDYAQNSAGSGEGHSAHSDSAVRAMEVKLAEAMDEVGPRLCATRLH